jgi:hypothetical protein
MKGSDFERGFSLPSSALVGKVTPPSSGSMGLNDNDAYSQIEGS